MPSIFCTSMSLSLAAVALSIAADRSPDCMEVEASPQVCFRLENALSAPAGSLCVFLSASNLVCTALTSPGMLAFSSLNFAVSSAFFAFTASLRAFTWVGNPLAESSAAE